MWQQHGRAARIFYRPFFCILFGWLGASAAAISWAQAGGSSAVLNEPVACPPVPIEQRAVAAVKDGATLLLTDSTELRLAGILAPTAADVPVPVATWPPEDEARRALLGLTVSGIVDFAAIARRDRYGRRIAHARVTRGAEVLWLQEALVSSGQARVAPLPGETACLRPLLAVEDWARRQQRGIWANPAYAVRPAHATRDLTNHLSTFQIVDGRIVAVGRARHHIYLNFGANWRWDFTAALEVRNQTERAATFERLKRLEGRRVRVRGWIVRRNGPYVELASEEVIEILD